jgi:hypothetical protein
MPVWVLSVRILTGSLQKVLQAAACLSALPLFVIWGAHCQGSAHLGYLLCCFRSSKSNLILLTHGRE